MNPLCTHSKWILGIYSEMNQAIPYLVWWAAIRGRSPNEPWWHPQTPICCLAQGPGHSPQDIHPTLHTILLQKIWWTCLKQYLKDMWLNSNHISNSFLNKYNCFFLLQNYPGQFYLNANLSSSHCRLLCRGTWASHPETSLHCSTSTPSCKSDGTPG